jgi:hypothetical protein
MIFFSILLVSSGRVYADPCLDEKLAAETSGNLTPPEIRPWSFSESNIQLTPQQLLPEAYFQKIAEKKGTPVFSVEVQNGNLVSLQIATPDRDIIAKVSRHA